MGPRVMRRLPKFVHGFIDRHGKPRFYFRRAGHKKVRLPGLPWSPEFMAAYEEALAGQPVQIGSARVRPGTLRALAVSYFASPTFRTKKPSTQYTYRNVIDRLCQGHGDKRPALLQREHVIRLIAARAGTPGTANALRRSLRALMQHAVEIGMRADDPTRDVRAIPVRGDGYHSWSESEIAQFERHHPAGSRARLAFALLLYTGQRRSDVVRMGRQHTRGGAIEVKQVKTGREVWIPVHEALASIIAETATSNLTFLVTDQGKPYSAAGFGNWFRDQCRAAGLHGCSAHGLRKAAARRLAEAGCSAHEISAITGHASLREVARYTEAADRRKLAASAMAKVKGRTSSG
ncbi:MAG: tyrosine-type recombinase/integrase [Hyphomicrobiales bacterium]|jgi:integrase